MKKFLFIIFFFVSAGLLSQNVTETAALFSKNLNSFYKDPSQTIRVANYLHERATTNTEKAKALYLLSESKKLQGNYIESIESLYNAKVLIEPKEDNFIHALLLVSIAERCRISGVNDISKNYLQQAERHVVKIRDKEEMIIAKAFVLQEKAEVYVQSNQLSKALESVQKAESLIDDIQTTQPSLLAVNAILQGNIYVQKEDFKMASLYYKKAFVVLKESDLLNSSLEAEALYGIAAMQYSNKESTLAEENLLKAVSIPVVAKPVKVKLLKQLAQIYKAEDSIVGFQERYKESSALSSALLISERKVRNTILSQIEEEQEAAIKTDKRRYYFIGGVIISILVLALLGYYFYNKKLDREYQKFEKIIRKLENKEKIEAPVSETKNDTAESKGVVIPKETEAAILERLDDFEASTKYTNSDISLPVLAKQMQTNTKYISEIIHIHKNKNFNTYINELRINHIIQLMKEDKKYLNYKVSYLAEESGFSSHSAFTVVFKSITGITPKQFISFLKKDEKVAS